MYRRRSSRRPSGLTNHAKASRVPRRSVSKTDPRTPLPGRPRGPPGSRTHVRRRRSQTAGSRTPARGGSDIASREPHSDGCSSVAATIAGSSRRSPPDPRTCSNAPHPRAGPPASPAQREYVATSRPRASRPRSASNGRPRGATGSATVAPARRAVRRYTFVAASYALHSSVPPSALRSVQPPAPSSCGPGQGTLWISTSPLPAAGRTSSATAASNTGRRCARKVMPHRLRHRHRHHPQRTRLPAAGFPQASPRTTLPGVVDGSSGCERGESGRVGPAFRAIRVRESQTPGGPDSGRLQVVG